MEGCEGKRRIYLVLWKEGNNVPAGADGFYKTFFFTTHSDTVDGRGSTKEKLGKKKNT